MIAWSTRVSPDIMSLKLLGGRLEIYVAYGSPGSPICAMQFHCIVKLQPAGAYSDEIVHPFRRKASTRSGSNRPAVPVEIVRLFQAKSPTCSGSKNPVVSASPVDQVGAKRRAA